jgi:hypothetical protein
MLWFVTNSWAGSFSHNSNSGGSGGHRGGYDGGYKSRRIEPSDLQKIRRLIVELGEPVCFYFYFYYYYFLVSNMPELV